MRGLAVTLALVGIGSCLSLVTFFVVGGPFGAVNDVGNGAFALLGATMAMMVWRSGIAHQAGARPLATAAAVLGAGAGVVGSALILWDITGFFLAGLVSALGFALIGVWLVAFNLWIRADVGRAWSRRLPTFGVVAGATMMLGLVGVPGIAAGLDDMEAAPVWLQAAGLGWAGTYILLPIWSIWFSRDLAGASDGPS